ncbi:MAG TPA: preprotein translocase subunit Sec61beta [Desulfurococcales archaeon]|nr:preprotein translocase subunit Sec61beta [Desulfurococcales archaeon]
MSRRRRRREAGGPITAAGLIRFYEETEIGIKVKPHVVIVAAIIFTVTVLLLRLIIP